jgi:glutamate-1-semialdehyde 2,1-aminomutase
MRRVADLVGYCMTYEFEDSISEVTGADRVDVTAESTLELSRRAYKLVRMASRSRTLARSLAPRPSIVRLDRDYELFFPTFNHTHELYALTTIPDWRARSRFAACYIDEVWPHLLPQYLLELLSRFDHVFLGTRHCVDDVARIVGRPCSYLPAAVDVLRFSPWPQPPHRSIDVCNIGRRSPVTHQAFLQMAHRREIYYYYDTLTAPGYDKQRTFHVGDAREHRLLLAGLLQRSRYYIANRARANEPEHTGGREELSARFYEGAAAGTVMLGDAPNTAVFEEQFGWPDSVIHLPFDCDDVEARLAALDADPARLARISRQNAHQAALRHDWLYRLQRVFATFGLKPTGGMLEREQRLREIAAMALRDATSSIGTSTGHTDPRPSTIGRPVGRHTTAQSTLGGTSFALGRALAERGRRIIPGGSHTYAKGDDQFPEAAPAFIAGGRGCHVWDVDGNEFIEYNMGLRAVTLGHAYDPVMRAAAKQLPSGTNFTRPAPIEVECAEAFLELIGTADMVKFCKDGSTAIDGAVRLSRAHTGRDMIAICGDHPFFSTSDWFIGTTGMPAGIPDWLRQATITFRYNDLASVQALFDAHPGRIACVILEPARTLEPAPGFLADLKSLCHRHGALLVFDEMITGFRWHRSGAQHVYDVAPDLSAFGKAMANGFALSAVAGKREFMRLGGADHDRERVFLLSTTHGAETHGLAAGIATMHIYRDEDVTGFLHRQGRRLREGVDHIVRELHLEGYFGCIGRDCCILYTTCDAERRPSQPFRTLFLQETIRRGLIAPALVVSYSHSDGDIDRSIAIIGEALWIYRKALEEGVDKYLQGRSVQPVFRRFA